MTNCVKLGLALSRLGTKGVDFFFGVEETGIFAEAVSPICHVFFAKCAIR